MSVKINHLNHNFGIFSLIKLLSQAQVEETAEDEQQCHENADLSKQRDILDSQIPQEHFGVVEVAVDVTALEFRSIEAKNCENQRHDTTANEGELHEGIHERRDVSGEVKSIDCEAEEGSHQSGTHRAPILEIFN